MTEIADVGGRYELSIDGERVAVSTYRDAGERRVFLHTEVEPDHEGQGLAGRLVGWALADVRTRGKRIVARCPYVAHYLESHHEFDDLVDEPHGVD